MSKNKHTPGPWEAQWSTETYANGQSSGPLGWNVFHRCETGLLEHVAELPDTIQREANARLIAAAPDLLEAAEEFVDYYEGRAQRLGNGQSFKSWQKLRELINTAKEGDLQEVANNHPSENVIDDCGDVVEPQPEPKGR